MDETEINRQMEIYTGMDAAQREVLHLAATWKLTKINPARAKAMVELINDKLWATEIGQKLISFADQVVASDYYLGPREAVKPEDYARIARLKRREWRWFSLGHLRVMMLLYNQGCVSVRWLTHVYGYRSVVELEQAGLIRKARNWGDWSIYELEGEGSRRMQDWGLI